MRGYHACQGKYETLTSRLAGRGLDDKLFNTVVLDQSEFLPDFAQLFERNLDLTLRVGRHQAEAD
jgi:hypothetical protein